jgi:hypothetical protein
VGGFAPPTPGNVWVLNFILLASAACHGSIDKEFGGRLRLRMVSGTLMIFIGSILQTVFTKGDQNGKG